MASLIHLDTHVAAWLYAGRLDLFPEPTREFLETRDLLASPMVRLELQYLFEIGRVAEPANEVIQGLATEVGLAICDLPFDRVVSEALRQTWTRDPFDRLIVAQASIGEAALITKDETILQHCDRALWEPRS